MATAHTEYLGHLRTQATHVQSGTSIITDAPTDNHGRGEAFSPTDLVAAALGSCMITIMGIMAQREGIKLDGTVLDITKTMSAELPRRIVGIKVVLQMETDRPLSEVEQKKYERAGHTCPVALSLHPDLKQDIVFLWD